MLTHACILAPVFFLHHAQLDRLWWIWQKEDAERVIEYNGPKDGHSEMAASLDDMLSMLELAPDIPVRDMMSTESDTLCYVYK